MGADNMERHWIGYTLDVGSPSTDDAIVAGAYAYLPRKFVVESAVLVNGATLAAGEADYVILQLKAGSTIVAEINTRAAHENGLVADVAKAMNVVTTADANVLAAGTTLTVVYDETDAGTNVALTSAKVIVHGWWKESA